MYRVLLDQTAFFPEGGGQPADEGTLDGIFVTDVQEIDGEIWHTVEAPLEPGKTVVGKIDFEKRFSNMQNHCGDPNSQCKKCWFKTSRPFTYTVGFLLVSSIIKYRRKIKP